jgi:hypothetical protein
VSPAEIAVTCRDRYWGHSANPGDRKHCCRVQAHRNKTRLPLLVLAGDEVESAQL